MGPKLGRNDTAINSLSENSSINRHLRAARFPVTSWVMSLSGSSRRLRQARWCVCLLPGSEHGLLERCRIKRVKHSHFSLIVLSFHFDTDTKLRFIYLVSTATGVQIVSCSLQDGRM